LPNYVDLAFTYARKANPHAKLFYNDYNVVSSNAGKMNGIYDMAKSMIDRKIPIDGIGLQMHVKVDDAPSAALVSETIRKFGSLGLKVHITELDVVCPKCDGTDPQALQD
jgi:endo-1,4-beta-xylanase